MKISFLLSYTPNPRINKRVRALSENNEIMLIYWRRTKDHVWGNVSKKYNQQEIYIPANMGQPLKRILPTIKFISRAFRKLKKSKPDCIYLAGYETLAIGSFYKRFCDRNVDIVYEVADLHRLQIQPSKNFFMKLIQKTLCRFERHLCKRIALLVCTSQKFYSSYYSAFVPKSRYLYMANAPEKKIFEGYQRKTAGEFTVGFVGGVHFTNQIKLLAAAGKKCGVKIIIAGSFLDDELRKYCIDKGAICTGTYIYEKDIVNIYEKLNCVFSVYPADDENVKLALPNKLYESIICGLPIIVAKGTYLSEIVEKYQIGVSVDSDDIEQYTRAIMMLETDSRYYQTLVKNCNSIREECFAEVYNQKLLLKMEEVTRGGRYGR